MKNIPKRATKDMDFMIDGALVFIKSGQYEQMFGKIKSKNHNRKKHAETNAN